MKTYVLDTNVLLNDPRAITAFEENVVVLTEYVLQEIDEKKKGTEEINANAREVSRHLDKLTEHLSSRIISGQASHQPGPPTTNTFTEISLPNGRGRQGTLIILMDDPANRVQGASQDERILALVHKHRWQFKTPIIIVTKDVLMGIRAIGMGFGRQDYKRDQARTQLKQLPFIDPQLLPFNDLFNGRNNIKIPGILEKTYKDQDSFVPIVPGYYIIPCDHSAVLIHIDHSETVRVVHGTPNFCRMKGGRGIRARNIEQHAAADALLNKRKTLVCLIGPAGTGKTLMAIAAALETLKQTNKAVTPPSPQTLTRKERKQVRNQKAAQSERLQILIARPMISMGQEMGFLPGDVDEKMRPWIQPIIDNLEYLVGESEAMRLLEDGDIKLQPLPFIRGRSIRNAILIIDECQNTTPLEIKTILTRAGEGTRVILTGDTGQIDMPYIDKLSNGLAYAADRMGREEFAAVVPMNICERSLMAARAAELL